ncbi:MAG: IclR family transcriptional regulator [Candidatus Rokuibacteriota bacterium]
MEQPVPFDGTKASPVLKALAILTHVARASGAMTLTELSSAAALPKPTAHRLARLLEREGILAKDALTRRYVAGPALLELSFNALRNSPAQRNRRLLLERLSEKLGETVNLALLAGDEVLYLDRVESSWPLRMDFKPGSRVPIHATANGKLLLAHAEAGTRARLLGILRLTPVTARTITERARLEGQLAEIRRQGYSEDDEEFLAGVCCLAVPVRDRRGRVIAGLAVSAPSARFNLEKARAHLGDLQSTAAELGSELDSEREGREGA